VDELGLGADDAEELGVAGDRALRRTVRFDAPVAVAADRLLAARAEEPIVGGSARPSMQRRSRARAVRAADDLDAVEADAAAAAARVGSSRRSARVERNSSLMLRTSPHCVLAIWPFGNLTRESDTPNAVAPKSARRSTCGRSISPPPCGAAATAAAAGVEPTSTPNGTDDAAPPRQLAADREEAAASPVIAPYTAGPSESPATRGTSTR
jgi:hypothetical protein